MDRPLGALDGVDDSGSTTSNAAPGWYPTDEVPGGLRGWDGLQWTNDLVVPVPRPDPPSLAAVGTFLFIGVSMFIVTMMVGLWGRGSVENSCRGQAHDDFDQCVNDGSFGVDVFDTFGFAVAGVSLFLAIQGAIRRRRATADKVDRSAPSVSTTEDVRGEPSSGAVEPIWFGLDGAPHGGHPPRGAGRRPPGRAVPAAPHERRTPR